MVVAGIDSDARGSIALLDCLALTLDVYPLPQFKKELKSGKTRTQLDYPVVVAIMHDLTSHASVVWMEDQWSRPSQDIGAMFTFGQVQGDLRSAIAAGYFARSQDVQIARAKLKFVSAADWKHELGASADKKQTVALASAVFPECAFAWKMVKHTSSAEAALIAFYGACKEGFKFKAGTKILPYNGPLRTQYAHPLSRSEQGSTGTGRSLRRLRKAEALSQAPVDDQRYPGNREVQHHDHGQKLDGVQPDDEDHR